MRIKEDAPKEASRTGLGRKRRCRFLPYILCVVTFGGSFHVIKRLVRMAEKVGQALRRISRPGKTAGSAYSACYGVGQFDFVLS